MNRIPYVADNINGADQLIPIDDWALLKERKIFCSGPINDEAAHIITMQVNYLTSKSTNVPITLIINSQGGSVSAGLAIYDAMQTAECPIITVCSGICASMAAVIFAAGSKGNRYIMENAQVMCHQPSAGTQGMVSSMDIDIDHFKKTRTRLNRILAKHTGQSEERIHRDTEKDRWFSAEEAVFYGLADKIIYGSRKG